MHRRIAGSLGFLIIFFWIVLLGGVPFVFAQAAEDFPYLAEVVTEQVNIRAGQNENFEKIGRLARGEKVVVVGRSYDWDKIKLPENAGIFVNQGFIQEVGDGLGMAKGSRVNIRAGRGTNFSVVGTLSKGAMVKIIDQKDGWYKVDPVEGSYGWILTKYLKFVSKDIPPPRTLEMIVQKTEKPRIAAAAAKIPEPQPVSVTGLIEGLGEEKVSDKIRCKITAADGTVYYLQAYRSILDGFVNMKAKIDGQTQPDIKVQHPVVLVLKVQLLL